MVLCCVGWFLVVDAVPDYLRSLVDVLLAKERPAVGEVLDLSGENSTVEGISLPRKIFMRNCYKLLEEMIDKLVTEKGEGIFGRILLTGTPGTGKSAFAIILLQKSLKAGRSVLYHGKGLSFVAEPSGKIVWIDANGERKILEDNKMHDYIADGVKEPVASYFGKSIFVHSPLHAHGCQYEKEASMTLYMPLWSLSELQECNRLIYGKPDEDLLYQYALWGGTARWTLGKDREVAETQWNEALSRAQNTTLEVVVRTSSWGDASISDRLVHMDVDMKESVLVAYKPICASPRVLDELIDRYWSQLQREGQRLLVETADSPALASLRGHMFEGYFHRLMKEGTGQVQMRSLEEAGAAMESDPVELKATKVKWFEALASIGKLRAGVYYRPMSSNFESVDSFMLSSDDGYMTVDMFSVTVSRSHPTSAKGLEAILEILPEVARVRLMFCVPLSVYHEFKKQPYTGEQHQVLHGSHPKLQRIAQWVLGVPLMVVEKERKSEVGEPPCVGNKREERK